MVWSTFSHRVRVAAITIMPRKVNLIGPAGALVAAAQLVLEHVFASQTWTASLARVDAQTWFLLADTIRPPSAQTIIEKVLLWSRRDAARDVWAPSIERRV